MKLLREWIRLCLIIEGRKEDLLSKNPEFKDQIEFFSANDPSDRLKYIDWQLKIYKSGQALEQEIVDVVNAFHKFGSQLVKKDINAYKPEEFADLRDQLFVIEAKQEARKEKVEKRYQIEGTPDADVVYESTNWTMYHVKNKAASMKLGCNTKWCITMKDKHYFEEYDMNNVVFFFLISKTKKEKFSTYKIACAVQRGQDNEILEYDWFDAKDAMMSNQRLTKLFGQEMSEIKSIIDSITAKQPKSLMAKLFSDEVSPQEAEQIYHASKNNPELKDNKQFWGMLLNNLKITPELIDDIITSRNITLIEDLSYFDIQFSTNQINKLSDLLISKSLFYNVYILLNKIKEKDTLIKSIKYLMSYGIKEIDVYLMKLKNIPFELFEEIYVEYKENKKITEELLNSASNEKIITYLLDSISDPITKLNAIISNIENITINTFIHYYEQVKKQIDLQKISDLMYNLQSAKNQQGEKIIELIYIDVKNGTINLKINEQKDYYGILTRLKNVPSWIIDELLENHPDSFKGYIAANNFTPRQLDKLSNYPDIATRASLLKSKNISIETLKKMLKDRSSKIREQAKLILADKVKD